MYVILVIPIMFFRKYCKNVKNKNFFYLYPSNVTRLSPPNSYPHLYPSPPNHLTHPEITYHSQTLHPFLSYVLIPNNPYNLFHPSTKDTSTYCVSYSQRDIFSHTSSQTPTIQHSYLTDYLIPTQNHLQHLLKEPLLPNTILLLSEYTIPDK